MVHHCRQVGRDHQTVVALGKSPDDARVACLPSMTVSSLLTNDEIAPTTTTTVRPRTNASIGTWVPLADSSRDLLPPRKHSLGSYFNFEEQENDEVFVLVAPKKVETTFGSFQQVPAPAIFPRRQHSFDADVECLKLGGQAVASSQSAFTSRPTFRLRPRRGKHSRYGSSSAHDASIHHDERIRFQHRLQDVGDVLHVAEDTLPVTTTPPTQAPSLTTLSPPPCLQGDLAATDTWDVPEKLLIPL